MAIRFNLFSSVRLFKHSKPRSRWKMIHRTPGCAI